MNRSSFFTFCSKACLKTFMLKTLMGDLFSLINTISKHNTQHHNKHVWSYNVSVFACTIAVPGAFVYGAAA